MNIYVLTSIFTCYITAQESDVQGEQMTGNSLPCILPLAPNDGKHNLCRNICNEDICATCSINL